MIPCPLSPSHVVLVLVLKEPVIITEESKTPCGVTGREEIERGAVCTVSENLFLGRIAPAGSVFTYLDAK